MTSRSAAARSPATSERRQFAPPAARPSRRCARRSRRRRHDRRRGSVALLRAPGARASRSSRCWRSPTCSIKRVRGVVVELQAEPRRLLTKPRGELASAQRHVRDRAPAGRRERARERGAGAGRLVFARARARASSRRDLAKHRQQFGFDVLVAPALHAVGDDHPRADGRASASRAPRPPARGRRLRAPRRLPPARVRRARAGSRGARRPRRGRRRGSGRSGASSATPSSLRSVAG